MPAQTQTSFSGISVSAGPNQPSDLYAVSQFTSGQWQTRKITHEALLGLGFTNQGSVGGVLTLNYQTTPHWNVNVTENVTALVVNNLPPSGIWKMLLALNISGGGGYDFKWPTGWFFPNGGVVPPLSRTGGVVDLFEIIGFGVGNIYVNPIGQNFLPIL